MSYLSEWKKRNPDKVRAYYQNWKAKHWDRTAKQRHISKMRHVAKKIAAFESLKNKPCADCGNSFPPECMDFDHVRGKKQYCVSDLMQASADTVQKEIAKCDLVCANCHRIRTRRRTRGKASSNKRSN